MAQQSGFFNAFKSGATYAPKYNANDFSNNLAAIVSTGVRRSGENDLYVQAAGGMALTVGIGRAWINGRWYFNDSIYTDFSVPTAPTGDRGRVDRVALRLTINGAIQNIELVYLTGTAALSPTAPALTRNETTYEIALADIAVNPNATQITQSDIYDRRSDKEVCGWITTPVGYDDYFTSLDAEFNNWFAERRNDLAVSTLYKEYSQRITVENLTSTVIFNIPQYDPTGVDILKVYVNGLLAYKDEDYTVNNSTITFTNEKIAGTEIDVYVVKSIDGTGLGSVSDEIAELQEQMATVKNIGDYIYICNGYDDNVKLSDIAQEFLATDTDNNQMIISVYGTFGANAPYGGSGLSNSRYRWFSLGSAGSTKRKIVFDFEGCSQITLNCQPSYHYIGFYGQGVNIRNANVVANCRNVDGSFQMFSSTSGSIIADNCRFWISGYSGCYIAQTGTFTNCRGDVTNSRGDSYCFNVSTNGLLRINGGEYYAYTGLSANAAAVVYIDSSAANAVAIANGMNCPTVAKDLHYQKNAVLCNTGYGSFSETITALTVTKATSQNVRGTIPLSKPDRM